MTESATSSSFTRRKMHPETPSTTEHLKKLYPRLPKSNSSDEEEIEEKLVKVPETASSKTPLKTELPVLPPESHTNCFFYFLVLVTILLAVILGCYFRLNNKNAKVVEGGGFSVEKTLVTLNLSLEQLRAEFPSQREHTWRTVSSVIKNTLLRDPEKMPGVISFISHGQRSVETANCLARKVASIVQHVYNDSDYVGLRGEKYSQMNAYEAKEDIHEAIRKGLENGVHTVVLEDLQAIPPKSLLLFHGLCDNDNAPYKNAIYIFTVRHLSKATDGQNLSELEVTAGWAESLGEDIRYSIESRIGHNAVKIDEEDDLTRCT